MERFGVFDASGFTTGTIGPKGQRLFLIQVSDELETTTIKIEKQQVLAMAEYLAVLLSDLPEVTVAQEVSAPPIDAGSEPAWVVGSLGAGYDADDDRVIILIEEFSPEEDDTDVATLRFRIDRAQTVAFVERAYELVEGGRPPCPWCEQPLNYGPDGFCACWN